MKIPVILAIFDDIFVTKNIGIVFQEFFELFDLFWRFQTQEMFYECFNLSSIVFGFHILKTLWFRPYSENRTSNIWKEYAKKSKKILFFLEKTSQFDEELRKTFIKTSLDSEKIKISRKTQKNSSEIIPIFIWKKSSEKAKINGIFK